MSPTLFIPELDAFLNLTTSSGEFISWNGFANSLFIEEITSFFPRLTIICKCGSRSSRFRSSSCNSFAIFNKISLCGSIWFLCDLISAVSVFFLRVTNSSKIFGISSNVIDLEVGRIISVGSSYSTTFFFLPQPKTIMC